LGTANLAGNGTAVFLAGTSYGCAPRGGINLDLGYGVAADALGNSYLAGFFASTTVPFDGVTLTNTGGRDLFITKLGAPIVPTLSLQLTNGQTLLSWPAAAAGYTLNLSIRFNPFALDYDSRMR
jgi:hypothetical protein